MTLSNATLRPNGVRRRVTRLLPALLLAAAVVGVVRSATSTVASPPAQSTPSALAVPMTPQGAPSVTPQGAASVTPPAPVVPSAPPAVAPAPLAPPPTSEAWSKAPLIAPRRAVGPQARACQVQAIGEWFKVRCTGLVTSAITELGGNSQNVYLHLDAPNDDGLPREGVVVFALPARERRVLSFWTLGEGYDGPLTVIAGVVLQAYWQGGQPIVLLHDAFNQPVRTAQSELRARDAAASANTAKESTP